MIQLSTFENSVANFHSPKLAALIFPQLFFLNSSQKYFLNGALLHKRRFEVWPAIDQLLLLLHGEESFNRLKKKQSYLDMYKDIYKCTNTHPHTHECMCKMPLSREIDKTFGPAELIDHHFFVVDDVVVVIVVVFLPSRMSQFMGMY